MKIMNNSGPMYRIDPCETLPQSDRDVLNLPFEFDFTKKLYSLKCPCDSIFGIPHFYILVKSMTLLLNYPQNSGNRISGTKKIKQFSRAVDPLGRHHYQSCKKTKNVRKPDLWESKMSPIIPYVRHKNIYQ